MAPFDEEVHQHYITYFDLVRIMQFNGFWIQFYLIVNLAVGGTNGFFPDAAVNEGGAGKPWSDTSNNVNSSC